MRLRLYPYTTLSPKKRRWKVPSKVKALISCSPLRSLTLLPSCLFHSVPISSRLFPHPPFHASMSDARLLTGRCVVRTATRASCPRHRDGGHKASDMVFLQSQDNRKRESGVKVDIGFLSETFASLGNPIQKEDFAPCDLLPAKKRRKT